jgi:predicted secreted hydrolase
MSREQDAAATRPSHPFLSCLPGGHGGRRRGLLAGALTALCSAVLLVFGVPSANAITLAPVSLPADEAPHPTSSMEWWYFTGHLSGKDLFGKSHQYGFELTMIRMDALASEPTDAIYNAHLAITDLTRGTFTGNEDTYSLQADNIPSGGGFSNTVGLLHMDGKNGVDHLSGSFADLSYSSISLTLSQSQPAALHGDAGIIPYGPFGTSGYYSETNLKVSGTLWDHAVPVTVTGTAWQDHQWGDFTAGPGGWVWFSVQLTNNTQYMLYFIHDSTGRITQVVGTRVNADGTTTNLDPSALAFTPQGSWTSPHTGVTYQEGWNITVPGGALTVTPLQADQELYSSIVPQGAYWEGDSSVTGAVNGDTVTGQAYAEQTPSITLPTRGAVWSGILTALGL